MTFWEQFVKPLKNSAEVIQKFAYPGNVETQVSYEVMMAQASAAEKVLKDLLDRCPYLQDRIGLPDLTLLK